MANDKEEQCDICALIEKRAARFNGAARGVSIALKVLNECTCNNCHYSSRDDGYLVCDAHDHPIAVWDSHFCSKWMGRV